MSMIPRELNPEWFLRHRFAVALVKVLAFFVIAFIFGAAVMLVQIGSDTERAISCGVLAAGFFTLALWVFRW